MHYKNGRTASNGDRVILFDDYGNFHTGILYNAVPGNDACNGRIALTTNNDPYPDLQNVLHIEDAVKLLNQETSSE